MDGPKADGTAPRTGGFPSEGSEPPVKKQKQIVVPKHKQMIRPGHGTKGSKVTILCNHFKVTFKPSEPVYQYNVVIDYANKSSQTPPIKNFVNRKVMAAVHSTYGTQFLLGKRFAYDGEKSLFIVGPLSFNKHEFPVLLEDEPGRGRRPRGAGTGNSSPNGGSVPQSGREFVVKIEKVAVVDMALINSVLGGQRDGRAQDALRVLDIMLREHAAKRDYLLLKNSYFHPSLGQVKSIGEGVDMWRGFHVSFRPTSGGLSLNFDVSTTLVIHPAKVLQFLEEFCKKSVRNFRPEDWMKSKKILKGLMVMTYAGRKHKIIGFSPEVCSKQKFVKKKAWNGDGDALATEEITVADYFEKERNLKLRFPDYPALDVGRPSKPMYFPLEVCEILPGQKYKRSLSTAQRQAQIDQTRQNPPERMQAITKALNVNDYNSDELVKEFGVTIEPKMASVSGRVLEPPKLLFGNRFEETPRNGRWNFGSKTMKKPVEIPNWAVAVFSGGRLKVSPDSIAMEMKKVCGQKGMKLGDYVVVEEDPTMRYSSPTQRVAKLISQLGVHLKKYLHSKTTDVERPFILAILPEKSPDLYVPFKRQCEVDIGIVTQCIVPPKGEVNPKYLTSVSLKINLKRGGYNSVLSLEESKLLPKVSKVPTIIFGLDVSHGSPGDASSPSVAAAVATVDWPRVSRYTTSVRAQPAKMEMIEGLHEAETKGGRGGMVRELLLNFYTFENRQIKPQQIVIFRDGVSESQFPEVLEKELEAFKLACASLDKEYNPRITFIVVQKRHHTRFFPPTGKDNVAPGTIVDKDACHPTDYDFYLCSHYGAIGTSRPTHYHVLYDEINFMPDELQVLTNSLCYSYTRCTSAVSVVAPAYYAHLAAQRCRNFVQDNFDSGSEGSSLESSRVEKAVTSLPTINPNVMNKMFYA